MKYAVILIVLCGMISCSIKYHNTQKPLYKVCCIKRIHVKVPDSEDYYEIKIKQDSVKYTIISPIVKSAVGAKIRVGHHYYFDIESNYEAFEKKFGVKVMPSNYWPIQYYANNLKGLYLIDSSHRDAVIQGKLLK